MRVSNGRGRLPLTLAVTSVLSMVAAGLARADAPVIWGAGRHIAGVSSTGTAENVTALACPGVRLCVGVNGEGQILVSTRPTSSARSWSVSDLKDGPLSSVSCPSTQLCVATDEHGNVLWSTTPSAGVAGWRGAHVEPAPYSSSSLADMQCPSTQLCVAIDGENGSVWSSQNPTAGASAWQEANIDPASADACGHDAPSDICQPFLEGLACHGAMCITDDYDGELFTSTDPAAGAAAWRRLPTTSGDLGGASPLTGELSCPSATSCFLAGQSSQYEGSDEGVFRINPTTGAGRWLHVGGSDGIYCPTVTRCFGAYVNLKSLPSTVAISQADLSTTPPSPWRTTNLQAPPGARNRDPDIARSSTQCPTPAVCVAVDTAGDLYVGHALPARAIRGAVIAEEAGFGSERRRSRSGR